MLHAAHAARSGDGTADSDLGGNLFVRCPFDVNFGIIDDSFGDFGAGSAGV